MKKKIFIFIGAIVAGLAVWLLLGGIKYFQIQALSAKFADFELPPSSVTSQIAQEREWVPSLKAVGSMAAVQGVMVSTDRPGIVIKINFESGQTVKKGDLLVQLDVSQEEAQLRAAIAEQKLAGLNLRRQQDLLKNRVSAQSELDNAQAEYDKATAHVMEMQSQVDRKTIRAPFSGVLGIRMVNIGQYMESGAKVVELQSLDPIYVNFWLPQQYLDEVAAGQDVLVRADGLSKDVFKGKINAVGAVVDEATRNVEVQATVANPKALLRAGMFANVEVPLAETLRHVVIPATAIQYAPYGNTVFIIEEMKDAKGKPYRGVRQQVVKLGETMGDLVAIVDGVKPGEEVVTSGVFKLRQGAAVQVNNTILPASSASPTPKDS